MKRSYSASFLLTCFRPSVCDYLFSALKPHLLTRRTPTLFGRLTLSTMPPTSPSRPGLRDDLIDLTHSPAQSISEDEDEVNLKKAIALSLQSTNDGAETKTLPPVIAASDTVGIVGLDRKQMEAERLARLKRKRTQDISPPPVTRRLRSPAPTFPVLAVSSSITPLKYGKPTLLRTWSASHPRSKSATDVKLPELLSPTTLQSAVLSSYIWDHDWLFSQFGAHLKRVKLLLVMHAKWPNQRDMITQDFAGILNVKHCFPIMEGQINCMHSKLMLLFFNNYMRIVVPTANLIPTDWGEGGIMENTVFVVDLPTRSAGLQEKEAEAISSPFLSSLLQYIEAQDMSPDVVRKVKNHDFSALANIRFVHTIGGPHADPAWRYTGIPGLGRAIDSLGLRLPKREEAMDPQLDFITSSLGSLNPDFIRSIYLGAAGDDGLTDLNLRTKSSSERKATSTHLAVGSPWLTNFRIYFPSSGTVHSSRGGPTRAGTICFQPRWWLSSKFPKENMRDCVSTREGLLMHNKILYATFSKPITGHTGVQTSGWVYVGSANLSESAWGRLVMDKASKQPKLNCRNWECGVVVPVAVDGSEIQGSVNLRTGDHKDLDVFKSILPAPMVIPAEPYDNGRLPWYFMADGEE